MAVIGNEIFLQKWQAGELDEALLDLEIGLIDERLLTLNGLMEELIAQKKAVSGGDDWHDGQFRATDNEANTISGQKATLLQALNWQSVEMPQPGTSVASLGSRATVRQNDKFTYDVDIVGLSLLHNYGDDDELVVTSLRAPLGRALIGKQTGKQFKATLAGRSHTLEVVQTMPSPELMARCR